MRYVIFGNGRAGSNIGAYLRHLGHETSIVSHALADEEVQTCGELIAAADVVAAAIPDEALEAWRDNWLPIIGEKYAIHFSGAMRVKGLDGFHPLYSFPVASVEMSVMAQIPFACPVAGPDFAEVFPGAGNPHFKLADADRARYHALAVLSGNLSAYLWNQTARPLEELSGVSAHEIMGVYLQSLVDRFLESPMDSLTGPVARRDKKTVDANLAALADNAALSSFYQTFLRNAWPGYPG